MTLSLLGSNPLRSYVGNRYADSYQTSRTFENTEAYDRFQSGVREIDINLDSSVVEANVVEANVDKPSSDAFENIEVRSLGDEILDNQLEHEHTEQYLAEINKKKEILQ